ncbi:MAG: putative PaaX family transcriptional regulator [Parcubacteria group bacterium Athens0714_25]|nr:MAG: putative PaaX family transcriptional regulator [Parcubacteria group bacterium Athens0714_25]
MSEILENLFGSKAKTRIIRFFLLNPDESFSAADISDKNLLRSNDVRRELNLLSKIKFLNERSKKGRKVYSANASFPFYLELKNLISKANVFPQCKSLKKITSIGDVKLALISGVFLNYPKGKADMILAVDNVNKGKLKSLMNNLEAEIGREIRYVLVSSEELKYRLDMLDRFLLDFLESPHDEVVNKLPKLKRLIEGIKK